MEFNAPLDLKSKIITAGVFALFLGITVSTVFGVRNYANFTGSAILCVLILLTYLFSTYKYVVTDTELIIKQRIREKKIPIKDIAEIQVNPILGGTMRVFGVGGLFGYYGTYSSQSFGYITLFTTQTKDQVYIRTKAGHNFLISPENAFMLVDKIENKKG